MMLRFTHLLCLTIGGVDNIGPSSVCYIQNLPNEVTKPFRVLEGEQLGERLLI